MCIRDRPKPGAPDAPGAPNAQLVAALPSAQVAERVVGASALAIRDALVRQDFAAVARHVAPGRGVCLAASKGAACRFMSRAELAACGKSQRRERWAVDSGRDEPFVLTCRQAMRQIFLGHEGLARASPSYNCFRRRPDNSGAALLRPALGAEVYVELFADDPDLPGEGFGWRSLWLVFAPAGPDAHHLVALVSHYWSI